MNIPNSIPPTNPVARAGRSHLRSLVTITGCLALGIFGVLFPQSASAADKPNVIVVVVDDVHVTQVDTGLGADDGYPYPLDITMTPALKEIAQQGITMEVGYSANPMCWPSRGAVITGRYPRRWGDSTKVPTEERWLSEYLKEDGYKTACFGKWHLRWDDKSVDTFKPLARGFDEFFGFLAGAHSYYLLKDDSTPVGKKQGPIFKGHDPATEDDLITTKPPYNRVLGGDPADVENRPWYLTEELTAQTLDFIDRSKDDPFFIYLAYNARHTPGEVPQHFRDELTGEGSPTQETQAAMVLGVDVGMEQIMAKLTDLGLRDNTLVIFVGDNGGPANANRNGEPDQPFRGRKGDGWEGGKRIPFIVSWPTGLTPDTENQRTYEYPVMHTDIVPTVLAAVGLEVPEQLDGANLLPYFRGETTGDPHVSLHFNNTARMGKWKFFYKPEGDHSLYDLEADPLEETDVASENPEVVAEIEALVLKYYGETGGMREKEKPKNED